MTPTAATVGNDRSSRPNASIGTRRASRASRIDYAALASMGKVKALTPQVQWKIIPCKVVLERLPLVRDGSLASVYVNRPETIVKRTSARRKSTTQGDNFLTERFSNVTRRSKPRRTAVEVIKQKAAAARQRHTISIVEESHGSIITVDESTDSSRVLQPKHNAPEDTNADGSPQPRRRGSTTRKQTTTVVESDKELEGKSLAITTTVRTKRRYTFKGRNASLMQDTGVCPPKKLPEASVPIVELSMGQFERTGTAAKATDQPAVQTADTSPIRKTPPMKAIPNPFKAITVGVKRVAPALTEAALKRLQYPELESTQEPKRSSVSIDVRQSSGPQEKRSSIHLTKRRPLSRPTLSSKPQIVVSAPIAEDQEPTEPDEPEPLRPMVDSNANNLLPPGGGEKQRATLKKPAPHKPPTLPLLIEVEEDDGKEDVYEFLSISQAGDGEVSRKAKRGRKPKIKGVEGKAKSTAKPAKAKKNPAARKKVGQNPFGCNQQQLARVIKHIGGGPVKSPAPGGYVVNLNLPQETLREPATPVGQRHITDDGVGEVASHFPTEARPPPNPAVDRLKGDCPSLVLPQTSTPINRAGLVVIPETSPQTNPASPWRLQDDVIVPPTSYMTRNREMLPSYESLASEAEYILPKPTVSAPAPPSLVTERRKPPHPPRTTTSVKSSLPASPATSPPGRGGGGGGNGIVGDKEIHEVDRLYGVLEATTVNARKLISGMHRCNARMANNPAATSAQRQEYQSAMKDAYDKVMQLYRRAMRSMKRSASRPSNARSAVCLSPAQSTDQQRTVQTVNHSTDQFRSMLNELELAMNDSNLENCSPPSSKPVPPPVPSGAREESKSIVEPGKLQQQNRPTKVTDVIVLPSRTNGAERNPLRALNFVPLPQRTSPLISPLAQEHHVPPDAGDTIRRELQYETAKEPEVAVSSTVVIVEPPASESVQPIDELENIPNPLVPEVGANEVVDICDASIDDLEARSDVQLGDSDDGNVASIPRGSNGTERGEDEDPSKDMFGFEEDSSASDRWQETQVTLPMPLNISTETLKRRLQCVKQLIPKRPIFRQQPADGGGPTRFPLAQLRVFGSPTKRPHTLRDFVASTPRGELSLLAAASGKDPQTATPDVSAIESNDTGRAEMEDRGRERPSSAAPDVVLFDTPEESKINRSTHQRTYARIPKRRKKINIYLANLGLDDDDDAEEEDDPLELSSDDGESEEAKRRKKKAEKNKKTRRKPKPVEETKEFKEFVDQFNSMCEEVEHFEMIIE